MHAYSQPITPPPITTSFVGSGRSEDPVGVVDLFVLERDAGRPVRRDPVTRRTNSASSRRSPSGRCTATSCGPTKPPLAADQLDLVPSRFAWIRVGLELDDAFLRSSSRATVTSGSTWTFTPYMSRCR